MAEYILGSRLRIRRKQLGFSQKELAEIVGIKRPSIGAIERGLSRKSSYIIEIARALNVNPDWLTGKTDDTSTKYVENRVTEILDGFSEPDKEEALRLIKAWSLVKKEQSGL
jgi:transcriptional regulator with XRE-family HTH domain